MLGPLLFVNGGAIVKNLFYKKKIFNSKKKIPKKPFSQKKFFTEHEFEKCCEAKKMHKGLGRYWAQKKFQPEKNNN